MRKIPSKECIQPLTICITVYHYCQWAVWFVFCGNIVHHFSQRPEKLLGESWFDLSFIDHSDEFNECSCWEAADVFNLCGYMLNSNISLCEEKQFETEVLSGQWLFEGQRHRNVHIYNVTNPLETANGKTTIIQELDRIPLLDRRYFDKVDKNILDEKGILAFSTQVVWEVDPSQTSVLASTDQVIYPHFVFATLLANSVSNTEIKNQKSDIYPLFLKNNIASFFKTGPSSKDYVTSTHADHSFPVFLYESESLANSFFVASRLGLQGLSFIRSVWDGEDQHCGYDSDCTKIEPKHDRIAMTSRSSCEGRLDRPFCKPSTLKYESHGLEFGVSSLRVMPGASYWGIDEVSPGENSVWDYTAFNKVGTIWPALNPLFFVLYDIVLAGQDKFLSVPSFRWKLAAYHDRRENCEGQVAAGTDSPGIDCSSPPGMVNVGPSFDITLPGPIYLSSGDFPEEQNVQIKRCGLQSIDCQQGRISFEMHSHEEVGFIVGYHSNSALSVRLQQNTLFSNGKALIPLYWIKDFWYMGQQRLYRVQQYDLLLRFTKGEAQGSNALQLTVMILIILYGFRRLYKLSDMDISGPYSDKMCQ